MSDFTEIQRRRRGHGFLPPRDVLLQIPDYYATERTPMDAKVIWLHYFAGGCDWWLAELETVEWTAFGAADLGHGPEWGRIDLAELERVRADGRIVTTGEARTMYRVPGLVIVERDCHWTPRTWGEIEIERHRHV